MYSKLNVSRFLCNFGLRFQTLKLVWNEMFIINNKACNNIMAEMFNMFRKGKTHLLASPPCIAMSIRTDPLHLLLIPCPGWTCWSCPTGLENGKRYITRVLAHSVRKIREMKLSKRPNSMCYSRTHAMDKFNLPRLPNFDQVQSSSAISLSPIPENDAPEKKVKLSVSLRSLKKSARRKSVEAFRQLFAKKLFKVTGKQEKPAFRRRVSNVSVEFWEEEYPTIRRQWEFRIQNWRTTNTFLPNKISQILALVSSVSLFKLDRFCELTY